MSMETGSHAEIENNTKNSIKNCLGDIEQDTESHRFNLIEAFTVYGLIIVDFWLIIWVFALDPAGPQIEVMEYVGYGILGLLAIWAIIISPVLHKDTFKGIGLGHPMQFIAYLKDIKQNKTYKKTIPIILIFLALVGGYTYQIQDIAEAFNVTTTGAFLLMVPLCIIALVLVCMFMIRWDNFIGCWKIIVIGICYVGPYLLIFGVIYSIRGDIEWTEFTGLRFFGSEGLFVGWFDYMWFGFIQHYIFLGYFNTRLRKGFQNKKYFGLHGKYWTGIVNMFFFGIIHIPAWELAIFAFTGGIFFSWFFQKPKYRNLFAFGIIHGFGGALLGRFVPWEMSVGPWGLS
jgi:hypothetical protein